ncbi:hypothetical protein ACFTQL_13845 [Peribacillus butanolivorans]|uniref:hypothetical protein n=1 Tax=Peribacillus butanolivorans TaxID=421767 RepID=UPI0006A6E481|nr:hypothetical protein [Peribacillus butanolivorans]KON69229.1 hypothetical protein AKG34_10880 [Peribacillus butanolivorans]MCO0599725.1 hypothetical protein [Peribacillus butanolivorans]
MIKSLKGQWILTTVVAMCFIYFTFSYFEFNDEEGFLLSRMLFFIAMISSVFNAGMLTQKYIQSKKK